MNSRKDSFGRKWDLIILLLSLYVVIELSITIILKLPANTQQVLDNIDLGICTIFLFDWFFFFFKAESKKKYFKRHFIDLVASIPFAQVLRPFRVLRIIRLTKTLRLLRGMKGSSTILKVFLKNPARSALTVYLSLTSIIYFYCSLGIYTYEFGVNESLNNFGDILWMSFTTLTSVGYGDIYPVTGPGRILAAVLVITGMGLFGLVTAEIASLFLRAMRRETSNSK